MRMQPESTRAFALVTFSFFQFVLKFCTNCQSNLADCVCIDISEKGSRSLIWLLHDAASKVMANKCFKLQMGEFSVQINYPQENIFGVIVDPSLGS